MQKLNICSSDNIDMCLDVIIDIMCKIKPPYGGHFILPLIILLRVHLKFPLFL